MVSVFSRVKTDDGHDVWGVHDQPASTIAPAPTETESVEEAKQNLAAAEDELRRLDALAAAGGVAGLRAKRARGDAEEAVLAAELALAEARATAVLEWDASRKRAQGPAVEAYLLALRALRPLIDKLVPIRTRAAEAFEVARATGAPVDAPGLALLDTSACDRLDGLIHDVERVGRASRAQGEPER